VLDWRPFDYLTLTTLLPGPDVPKVTLTYRFTEREGGGTHVEIRVGKPKPKDREWLEHVGAHFQQNITKEFETLRQMIEKRDRSANVVDEPPLRASAERFLTQPVRTP